MVKAPPALKRNTDDSTCVLHHESHSFGRHGFGRHDQVAFVLSALVIEHYHKLAFC